MKTILLKTYLQEMIIYIHNKKGIKESNTKTNPESLAEQQVLYSSNKLSFLTKVDRILNFVFFFCNKAVNNVGISSN